MANGETPVSGLEELLKLQEQGDWLYVIDADGTSRKMQASILNWQLADILCGKDVGLRRLIKRGRNLAELFTKDELAEKCKNKDFSNLFIDDYYEETITTSLGGSEIVRVEIWDFNYFLRCGDEELTDWHIVFGLHDQFATSAQMNSSNTTEGGYAGSALKTDVLPVYLSALNEVMGGHILPHRVYLTTTVNTSAASAAGSNFSGSTTGGEWQDSSIDLPSPCMVYGSNLAGSSHRDSQGMPMQLAKFAISPEDRVSDRGYQSGARGSWWLCAVTSSTTFAHVNTSGSATYGNASSSLYVRPYFLFG